MKLAEGLCAQVPTIGFLWQGLTLFVADGGDEKLNNARTPVGELSAGAELEFIWQNVEILRKYFILRQSWLTCTVYGDDAAS